MHDRSNDKSKDNGKLGSFGGHIVKGMIEEMEERMAAGEHISAAPSDRAEAELLDWVKQKNRESGGRANG